MKQLEPILKYHFWILLFVALIMAFAGWWVSTGQMQAAIIKRRADIAGAEERIPKSNTASADWEAKLKAINDKQKILVEHSRESLYLKQKQKMVWPAGDIRKNASQLKYLGEFDNGSQLLFRSSGYAREAKRVYEIPRPINSLDGSGVVEFSRQTMPSIEWGNHKPTSAEMWYSMEDLWLLEPILQAILTVNGGPEASRYDAVVVAINELQLLGGNRETIGLKVDPTADAGGIGGGGGGGGMFGGGRDRGRGPGGGGAGAYNRTSGTSPGTDINPVEELGDPGTGVGGAAPADEFGGGVTPGDGVPQPQRESLLGTGRRYIDDDPALPYRTRGFKLTVTMDHRRLPEFYAELTNTEGSPWPIQILRMNVAAVGESLSSGGRSGGQGSGGGSGMFRNESRRSGGGGGGGLMRKGGFGGGAGDLAENLAVAPAGSGTTGASHETAFLAKVTLVGLITLYNEPEVLSSSVDSAAGPDSTSSPESTEDAADSTETGMDGEMTIGTESEAMPENDGDSPEADGENMPKSKLNGEGDDAKGAGDPSGEGSESELPTTDAEGM
ncbi:MAG: hypothetical protein U0872_16030 [Planctomycetaceae bacterium]